VWTRAGKLEKKQPRGTYEIGTKGFPENLRRGNGFSFIASFEFAKGG